MTDYLHNWAPIASNTQTFSLYSNSNTLPLGGVEISDILLAMSLLTRTAVLQARVRPEISFASEDVLRRIGLNLTEAMELFLRRVLVDQRLPFEVVALDEAVLSNLGAAWRAHENEVQSVTETSSDTIKKPARRRQRLRRV
jgi:addiction module RelB/DinJ family antitoxin